LKGIHGCLKVDLTRSEGTKATVKSQCAAKKWTVLCAGQNLRQTAEKAREVFGMHPMASIVYGVELGGGKIL
jgi:hypothetical protein